MTTRTQHTLAAQGRTAQGLISTANRDHKKGRGQRLRHRKTAESDGTTLAPNVATWFKRHPREVPTFSRGEATQERPPEREPNEKGQAALDDGATIKTFKNGAKAIVKNGRIVQNLRAPNRTPTGQFSRDPFTKEEAAEKNLAAARRAIDAFFGNHDPSGPQLKGALLGLKQRVEADGGYMPLLDPEDL